MSTPKFKICPRCKIKKKNTEYHTRNDRGYIYLKSYCKKCSSYKTKEQILKQQYDKCNCGQIKSKRGKNCRICTRIDHNDLFVSDCKHTRHVVKIAIIRDKLIPYQCSLCNLIDSWNDKPITLQLDHINGINNDNRLINLRFLCPNCHSQTETFCGANTKK